MKYELHIRHGVFVFDDPMRRCYNGAYGAHHYEWSEWKRWIKDYTFDSLEKAEHAAKLFCREDQQVKPVLIEEIT